MPSPTNPNKNTHAIFKKDKAGKGIDMGGIPSVQPFESQRGTSNDTPPEKLNNTIKEDSNS